MKTLGVRTGAVKKAPRIFITQEDVEVLLGCGKSKAYDIVRGVNKYATKNGHMPFTAGKANKYIFSELYKIPMADIDRVLGNEEVVSEK